MDTGLAPRLIRLSILLVVLTMSGCATLSESQCRSDSWADIGFRDGRNGYSPDRIADHKEACEKYGIEPDRADYLAGRDEGLVQYCTRHNGFEVGRSNGTYEGVCATLNERAFLDGFNKGKALYEARTQLASVESEIHRVDQKREERDLSKEVREELFEKRYRLEVERVRTRERVERLERETQRL
jgi:hypothetical protein